MTITTEEAAGVARKYGLSMTDVAALVQIAATVEEAEKVAAVLAAPDDAVKRSNATIRREAQAGKIHGEADDMTSFIRRGSRR